MPKIELTRPQLSLVLHILETRWEKLALYPTDLLMLNRIEVKLRTALKVSEPKCPREEEIRR